MAVSEISHNLLYQPGAGARVVWDGVTFGLTPFQRNTGKGQGCLELDPQWVDPATLDFRLRMT